MGIEFSTACWSMWWYDMQIVSVISSSSNVLIATDCHVLVELLTEALPWHTCRQRYAQIFWTPVDVAALTETVKQRRMSSAGATASGVMSSGTLASSGSVSCWSDGSWGHSSPVCQCWGSQSLGKGSGVLCRTCAGYHASGVCKTCSDRLGIAGWKFFWICQPGAHDRQCYCQSLHDQLDWGPAYGEKYPGS
jgi:hypothetical protein